MICSRSGKNAETRERLHKIINKAANQSTKSFLELETDDPCVEKLESREALESNEAKTNSAILMLCGRMELEMVADWISQPNENKAETEIGARSELDQAQPKCNQPANW